MKKSIFLKQKKPLTVWMLGGLMLFMAAWFLVTKSGRLDQILTMVVLALILLGYSISYEITEDFNNRRHFKIFGVSLFKSKLGLLYPDYITVFSAMSKQSSQWGPISALGSERKGGNFVLRLFKGSKYVTVYRTKSLELAKVKALELSELLGVVFRGKN